MSRSSYQYETSPRKYEPDYDIPRKRTQQTRRKNSTKKTTAKKQTIKTNYQIKKEKKKIERAIRCFVPELLHCGYSRDEIYHSANNFYLLGLIQRLR